uniref:Golgi apparatus membrane protein TVP38 n=1 Tax=Ganoderma boninense TaxID=34458 RepID=A0A5K1K4A3_9APHY|nr:SGE1 protein [Ganoderma boninense]
MFALAALLRSKGGSSSQAQSGPDMSSRPNPYRAPNSVPPSYTVTSGGPKYPPNGTIPIAAPVPRAQSEGAYGFSRSAKGGDSAQVDVRQLMLTRTPSPTPSEQYALTHKSRSCDLKKMFDFKGNPRQILSVAIAVALIVVLILFLVFQKRIEEWLLPFANWMRNTPGGWLIPIAIMLVLSFPPLFGHEIVAILCGDVWGVGIGFGIVAAGTILGELANFFVFKYWCRARAKRTEEKNLKYALLAQVVRDGGFKIPVIMRLSAIPGHLLTAIFSTLGMSLWVFLAAAILGLPKQLAVVYIGSSEANPESAKKAKIIKIVVIVLTVLVTHFAMRYHLPQDGRGQGGRRVPPPEGPVRPAMSPPPPLARLLTWDSVPYLHSPPHPVMATLHRFFLGPTAIHRSPRANPACAHPRSAPPAPVGMPGKRRCSLRRGTPQTRTPPLPKALDADLERAAGVEDINLGAVPPATNANTRTGTGTGTGAPVYVYSESNLKVDPRPSANPFGSSMDTMASTATTGARGSRGRDAAFP